MPGTVTANKKIQNKRGGIREKSPKSYPVKETNAKKTKKKAIDKIEFVLVVAEVLFSGKREMGRAKIIPEVRAKHDQSQNSQANSRPV